MDPIESWAKTLTATSGPAAPSSTALTATPGVGHCAQGHALRDLRRGAAAREQRGRGISRRRRADGGGGGLGARRRLAGRDPLHAPSLRAVGAADAGGLPRRPDETRRIGTAVTVLPLVHLRIAEEVATVDQLSQGRFDFGIGRAAPPPTTCSAFPTESQPRFEEALAIIREAWKGERSRTRAGSIDRQHRGHAAAYQVPHRRSGWPPTRRDLSVGRPGGLPLFVGIRTDSRAGDIRSYRAAWREAGHAGTGDVCLRLPVYAAPTERASLEEPRENIMYFFQGHTELTRARLGSRCELATQEGVSRAGGGAAPAEGMTMTRAALYSMADVEQTVSRRATTRAERSRRRIRAACFRWSRCAARWTSWPGRSSPPSGDGGGARRWT